MLLGKEVSSDEYVVKDAIIYDKPAQFKMF